MDELVKMWGYKQTTIKGAICYTKEYDKYITIVIHKACVFVSNRVVLRQKEDCQNELKALKQGKYELSQVKLSRSL